MRSAQSTAPPLVSVIISSYNYGRYVGRAIESVQAQAYQNWECIVVDDGSTDETRAVVERYARSDGRIRYCYRDNGGPSAARNTGIRESSGEYLQFVDADDLIEPLKLQVQTAYLERHPEVDVVYGDMQYFTTDEAGEVVRLDAKVHELWVPEVSPSGTGRDLLQHLVRKNIMGVHSALVRRPTGGSDVLFDEGLRGPEDWYYWVCCAAAGKRFQHVAGILALVRTHPSSLSSNARRMVPYVLLARRKIRGVLKDPEILSVNDECAASEADWLMNEIHRGGVLRGVYDLLKLGLRAGERRFITLAFEIFVRISAARLKSVASRRRPRALPAKKAKD